MIKEYGLNSELKEKLRMKYEYYNEHTEIVDEQLEALKEAMKNERYKNAIVKYTSKLETRGGALNEMQQKASELDNDDYEFKKRAHQFRLGEECKKKLIYAGIIFLVVVIIVTVIVLIIYVF